MIKLKDPLSISLLIWSCTDPNLIGLEVQPPSDGIVVSLTSLNNDLKLSTISEDSLRSDEVSTLLLGCINDPVFGINRGSFATQFMLPFNNLDIGNSDSLIVDSVVLGLSYSGNYGNNQPMNISVYEIKESIHKDSVFFSNYVLSYDQNNLILNPNCNINLQDSILIGGEIKAPHLRLRLDNSVGDKILDASGTSVMENNAQFVEFFKGLYISSSSFTSILYLNPSG